MITRYGDLAQSQSVSRHLLQAQTRTRETQMQISSQKVGDRFSDLGSGTKRLLDARTMMQKARQFQSDNQLVQARLEVMESSITQTTDIATRLKSLLIQRLDDAGGTPGVARVEAEIMLDQAVSALNATAHGRHLFAGSKSDTPPVQLDPAFADFGAADATYYQGDGVTASVLADDNLEVSYGMSADREGFQELIGALRTMIEADPIDDEALLEDALDLVNAALPKLADYGGEVGARHNQLTQINDAHGSAELYLQEQISDVEGIDLSAAISRLAQDQMAVEASMATIARLGQLSLVDFLR